MRAKRWPIRAMVTAILIGVIASGAALTAIERMRLPSFLLTMRDGRSVATSALVKRDKWLVLYAPSGCESCYALLQHLAGGDPNVLARLVIVVGAADAASVSAAANQFPGLSAVAWYGDPSGAAVVPLRLGTAPAIFGLNGDMIEWSMAGVLSPSAELNAVLANWVAGP